jgi:hypothetical protein
MAASLYDIYLHGMLEDLHVANAKVPPDPNRYKRLSDFQEKVRRRVASIPAGERLKNFYVSPSGVIAVEHTAHSVRGAQPPCGAGSVKIDQQAQEYMLAIGAIGASLAYFPAIGQVAVVISAITSYLIGIGNTYQTDANCGTAVTLVPSCINSVNELDIKVWVGENQNPTMNAQRDPNNDGFGEWLHVEKPYLHPDVVNIAVKDPEDPIGGERKICPFKLVLVRVRNWSHNRNQVVYFRAYWDAPMNNPGCQCIDFSQVSELYRDSILTGFIDTESPDMARYVREYIEQSQ